MTQQQIIDSIERTGCQHVQVCDFAGNRLMEIHQTTAPQAVRELEECLPNYATYKKLRIIAKKGTEDTPWSKGYNYQLEFAGIDSNAPIQGTPIGAIGATEYIGMIQKFMTDNFELQKQIIELKAKEPKEFDPTKWIGLIEKVLPVFGIKNTSIAGNETTKDLHFEDAGEKLNDEQTSDAITSHLISISKKVKASDILRITKALDANTKLAEQAPDIAKVLIALAEKPHLLDMALKFI